MSNDRQLLNKVERKGILTIDLEKMLPADDQIAKFDLKQFLFKELILKEKDFRQALKEHNWEQYRNKHLIVFCSTKAIIPVWAYMLVAGYAANWTDSINYVDKDEIYDYFINEKLVNFDLEPYRDARVVVKGCGEKNLSPATYVRITTMLQKVAKSIMYGEPCSTVPIYKKG